MKIKTLALAIIMSSAVTATAQACTSVAWNTDLGTFTSRTNDWVESTNPMLGNINKGEMRSIQGTGEGALYQVKYDIVAVMAYGELVHDGVNSEGLQVNTLYYEPMTMEPVSSASQVTQFTFGEYVLANYATVAEAVKAIPELDYASLKMDGMPMEIKLHWSITDKSGDRAVIELDEDKLRIYQGEEAMVMTNQPSMQVHIDNKRDLEPRWTGSDMHTDYGSNGNSNAESRFIHASYFKSKLTEPTSVQNGMMKLSGVPFRVPADAPYKDFGRGMSGYATEWTLTQSLETGDSVFEYNFGDNWNTVRFNVYEMMGKSFRIPLATGNMAGL